MRPTSLGRYQDIGKCNTLEWYTHLTTLFLQRKIESYFQLVTLAYIYVKRSHYASFSYFTETLNGFQKSICLPLTNEVSKIRFSN